MLLNMSHKHTLNGLIRYPLGFGVVRWLVGLAAMALLATIACMTIPGYFASTIAEMAPRETPSRKA